jgi:hypothetical protein
MTETIQPVVVAIDVRRGIEEAFRVFTAEIGAWWPVAAHSVEPDKVETVVLEGRVGGRLYERWHDGGAGWHSRATAAGATVTNDEDRKIFTEDLATGPWFGLGVA